MMKRDFENSIKEGVLTDAVKVAVKLSEEFSWYWWEMIDRYFLKYFDNEKFVAYRELKKLWREAWSKEEKDYYMGQLVVAGIVKMLIELIHDDNDDVVNLEDVLNRSL